MKWIDTQSELPDNGIHVIACDRESKTVGSAYFNGGWVFEGDDECCVTHWMHYPSAPKI